MPRKRKQGEASGEHTPFLTVYWGQNSVDIEHEDPYLKTAMELRTEFIEHNLRRASELIGRASSNDDLQEALEIYRRCTEYYNWHKDSLPVNARDVIAEQLAQITRQLGELCNLAENAKSGHA